MKWNESSTEGEVKIFSAIYAKTERSRRTKKAKKLFLRLLFFFQIQFSRGFFFIFSPFFAVLKFEFFPFIQIRNLIVSVLFSNFLLLQAAVVLVIMSMELISDANSRIYVYFFCNLLRARERA